jgi:hypothetical protein
MEAFDYWRKKSRGRAKLIIFRSRFSILFDNSPLRGFESVVDGIHTVPTRVHVCVHAQARKIHTEHSLQT